jgi:hypothetical protein
VRHAGFRPRQVEERVGKQHREVFENDIDQESMQVKVFQKSSNDMKL